MVQSNIFRTELQPGGAGLYNLVFLNDLQKRPWSGLDWTMASLVCAVSRGVLFGNGAWRRL